MKLTEEHARLLDELVAAGRDAAEERLVVSTSGNLSVRLDGEYFAVTAARTHLGRLGRDDIVTLPVGSAAPSRAAPESGRLRPSRETPMHRALYQSYPELRCVLHFQSLAGTTLACGAGAPPNLDFIPELPVYVRRVASVPYRAPGTQDLARSVVKAFRDPEVRLVQLRNHGQVVIGDNPGQVVERATFFELAARIYLLSERRGSLRHFNPEELSLLASY